VSNVEPLRALAVSLSNGICGFMAFLKWPWFGASAVDREPRRR
jgi:hypothetical protein